MMHKWLGLVTLCLVAALVLSCGHSQELVSITIEPGTETFGASNIPVNQDAGLSVQLRALGTYVHPPVTKDITNQVTWSSNDTQMVTVNSTGLITVTGFSCGGTLISATLQTNHDADGQNASGAIITGTMTADVTCFTSTGTGSGPAVSVTFGPGSGTVSSTPSGLFCTSPTACIDSFPAGTVLSLTATPTAPSTTASWQGCPVTTSTNVCTFTLETNTTLTVSFS